MNIYIELVKKMKLVKKGLPYRHVEATKSILRVIGYTSMWLVFFALAVNVAYVFAHETPASMVMLLSNDGL